MAFEGASGADIAVYSASPAPTDAQGRKALFMLCAKDFCKRRNMAEPAASDIKREAHGKPYFDRAGAAQFCITHTAGLWACAFSRARVGLDAERISQRNTAPIASRFFLPEEREYTAEKAAENGENGEKAFYDVWTAKESFVKFTGEGIAGEGFLRRPVVTRGVISGEALGVCLEHILLEKEGYSVCLCYARDAT